MALYSKPKANTNPLSPGVKLSKNELTRAGGTTSLTIPGRMRSTTGGVAVPHALPNPTPFRRQGNVTSGSNFPGKAQGNNAPDGDSESYRKPAKPRYMRNTGKHSGFAAIKAPMNTAKSAGSSPKGLFPARMTGNFGRV